MANYKYNKEVLKGLGIEKFLNEVEERERRINVAKADDIQSIFNANKVSSQLHPHIQFLKIVDMRNTGIGKEFTFKANIELGTKSLATFRSGQFLSVVIEMPDRLINRTYCIASSPKEALGEDGFYKIVVTKIPNGLSSTYIHENWKIGDTIVSSGPLGEMYYKPLKDSKDVIAIAGGITPFLSMAKAINEGSEDFNLTIIYANKASNFLMCKDELDEVVAKSNGKVKVAYLLSDENNPNYEYGTLTAEFLKKYLVDKDCTIFIDWPKAFGNIDDELNKLKMPHKRIVKLEPGPYGNPLKDVNYPQSFKDKEFTVTVLAHGEENKINCRYDETLIEACQRLKLHVTTDCRSGTCGWCHSRLVSGDVFIPEEQDGRREADKKFGWIHPCVTYPLSDVTIEVFPNY